MRVRVGVRCENIDTGEVGCEGDCECKGVVCEYEM